MSIDKVTIINFALTDIGYGPVYSIDDDSDLSAQIENVWTRTLNQAFGMFEWSFAMRTVKLSRLAATPNNGWAFGYELPGNKIGDPRKFMARFDSPEPVRNFAIEATNVYTNEPDLWALYKGMVDPDQWDPPFLSAFTIALAGYLAVPVMSDENTRASRLQEAFGNPSKEGSGGLFGRLMAQNKASQPVGQPFLNQDPLTNARQTGGASQAWYGKF